MEEKNVKNYLYVCPFCLRILKECTCIAFPERLIQIDRNMLPIIRELNKKCFATETCCEGHIGSNEFMYIEFSQKYRFGKEIPTGFAINGHILQANITGKSEQAKKRKKRQLLNTLYQWACELEGIGHNLFIR